MTEKKSKEEHVHHESCKHDTSGHEDNPQQEQQKMLRLSILEQHARQIQQQMEMVDQQIVELQLLKMNLDDVKEADVKSEMLASIGKNIFVKASLQSKDLYVDLGSKTVVKKSVEETKAIIDKDISALTESRTRIMDEFNQVAAEIQRA